MKNLRKFVCLLAAVALLFCIAPSAFAEERADMDKIPYADALYHLGLFRGTDKGYELDASLTREQAITLVVRFLGAEEKALADNAAHPFMDVAPWASPYVGYAYAAGITNGISDTLFDAENSVTENQFMTFLLRILKYQDGTDFTWDAPYALAREVGLVPDDLPQSTAFTRGDAVVLCWRLLNLGQKGVSGTILADGLIEADVFTAQEFEEAKDIVAGEADLEDFFDGYYGGGSGDDDGSGGGFGGGTDDGFGGGSSGGSDDGSDDGSGDGSGDGSDNGSGDGSGGDSDDGSGDGSGDSSGGSTGSDPGENETEDIPLG